MAKHLSRGARKVFRNVNGGAADVKGFVEENPVTSAIIALAAGVLATSAVKMTMGRSTEPASKAPVKKADRKADRRAERRADRKAGASRAK